MVAAYSAPEGSLTEIEGRLSRLEEAMLKLMNAVGFRSFKNYGNTSGS